MALEETVNGIGDSSPRAKEKGPQSLRTEGLTARRTVESMHEAWPEAHHMTLPDLAIRQRQLCSRQTERTTYVA
jgi:hypothetical protein